MAKNLSMKARASLTTRSFDLPPALISAEIVEKKVNSGPGNSIIAMMSDAKVAAENKLLKEKLSGWEGASLAKRLDAATVDQSKWANRHGDSFKNKEFDRLKADIESAGGNVQAIKVRPTLGSDPQRYEIVFGHRRHRACLDLGLPVLAVIESINEHELFVEMDRENRQRADLRPYEQGEMYRCALDEGLYPSLRKLAEALGISHSNVSRALNIARLPPEILDAFPRLEIQYRWVEQLTESVKLNSDVLVRVSKEIIDRRTKGENISPKRVFDLLTNSEVSLSGNRTISAHDQKGLTIKKSKSKVTFELGIISPLNIQKIEDFILQTLKE